MQKKEKSHCCSARKAAIEYGIDMTLVDINLQKTPEERICDINSALIGILELREGLKLKNNKMPTDTTFS